MPSALPPYYDQAYATALRLPDNDDLLIVNAGEAPDQEDNASLKAEVQQLQLQLTS